MDAYTTAAQDIIETPAVGTAAPAVSWSQSTMVRAAAVGLAFSLAFSSSFVIGFYWLGPWLDHVRSMI